MAAKKFGKPAARSNLSPLAQAFVESDAAASKHPQFEAGSHVCRFVGIQTPPPPVGKDPWAICEFELESGETRVSLHCLNHRSLSATLPRLKSLCMAVIGAPSLAEYQAFDPEGVFFSAMTGFENEMSEQAAAYSDPENPTYVRVVAVAGKEDGNGGHYMNYSYEGVETEGE